MPGVDVHNVGEQQRCPTYKEYLSKMASSVHQWFTDICLIFWNSIIYKDNIIYKDTTFYYFLNKIINAMYETIASVIAIFSFLQDWTMFE